MSDIPENAADLITAMAGLTIEHNVVIDLIGLQMKMTVERTIGKPVFPPDHQQWCHLVMEIRKTCSPVVMFLVRAVADMAIADGYDREEFLSGLRRLAAARLTRTDLILGDAGPVTS